MLRMSRWGVEGNFQWVVEDLAIGFVFWFWLLTGVHMYTTRAHAMTMKLPRKM